MASEARGDEATGETKAKAIKTSERTHIVFSS